MNEKIKELAEQAAGNFTQNFNWDYLLEIDKDIFEKFAELIVKETMQVVANQLPSNVYLDVADAVIKHFESK